MGFYSRMRTSPYFSPAVKALAWFPVVMFFVDHGFSYGTVHGRSMQVRKFYTHKKNNNNNNNNNNRNNVPAPIDPIK